MSDRGDAGARAVGAIDDDDDGGGAGVSYGVVVRNTPTAQHRNGSTSCSRSDISGWRDAALYPFAAPRRPTMARSAESDPLVPPGGRRRRFLFSECRIGATLELGRSGRSMMMMMVVVPASATGSSCATPQLRSTVMGLRRVLAPTFQAGEMPLFIPSRRRADRPWLGQQRATRLCRLAADVGDFFLANVGSGRRWSSGGRGDR